MIPAADKARWCLFTGDEETAAPVTLLFRGWVQTVRRGPAGSQTEPGASVQSPRLRMGHFTPQGKLLPCGSPVLCFTAGGQVAT